MKKIKLFAFLAAAVIIFTPVALKACSFYTPPDLVVYFDKVFGSIRITADNYQFRISSTIPKDLNPWSLCGPSYDDYLNLTFKPMSVSSFIASDGLFHLTFWFILIAAIVILIFITRKLYRKYQIRNKN